MYNDTVLDHFTNPRNVGMLEDADGIGKTGNPADGDSITIYIKVRNDILQNVLFKTFGCGAAIAASSMLTVLAAGKTLDEGMNITNDDVAEALGGLPPQKLICSNFAADALHAAIEYYRKNNKHSHNIDNPTENITESISSINNGLKDKSKIQRYLRHIIMPKISGAGQSMLIETRILLCAQSINTCDIMLNYLAASGISSIYCFLENKDNSKAVLKHVSNLNPEVNIVIIENIDLNYKVDFNILIGDSKFLNRISNKFTHPVSDENVPTFVSAACSWQGYAALLNDVNSLCDFLSRITEKHPFSEEVTQEEYFDQLGKSMSFAFINTLIVTELVKARLNIGSILDDCIYFDLLEMTFGRGIGQGQLHLKPQNFKYCDIKDKLSQMKVLIVGTGGLGCPAALSLSKAGVGTIGLIDFDTVDLSNLNRQILHTTSTVGMKKVDSAKIALNIINKDINIETFSVPFTHDNAMDIINNYDLIIDGLDNFPARYLLNDACYFAKKPLVEAGAITFYGQITAIVSEDGPCYRCLIPKSREVSSAPSCSEVGILGPVVGLMGILEAVETLKMIIGTASNLKGKLLLYDAMETDFSIVDFNKNANCELCGDNPSILQLSEYTFVCKDKES